MKIFLKVLLILASLLLLALLGMGIFIEQRLDDLLRSRISEQLGDEFSFDFRESKLNFLNNDLRILDLSLSRSNGDSLRWIFTVDQVKLTGFRPVAFVQNRLLAADSISLKSPDLEVFQIDLKPNQRSARAQVDSALSINFAIKYIRIAKAHLNYDPAGPERLESELEVDLVGIFFQGNILAMTDSLDDLKVSLPNIKYVTADSIYTIKARMLQVSGLDSLVFIDSFSVKNNVGLTEFSRFMNWRKALFDIEVPQISMSLPQPFQDTGWSVTRVRMEGPKIQIMKDLRFPLPDRKTELPQEQLKSLALKFKIDSLNLIDAAVEIQSRVSGSSTSDLVISNIDGSATNLQNFDLSKPAYKLVADGKLMRQADLHADITYLYGAVNPFYLNGSVQDIKLAVLDSYLRRQIGVTVASGKLDGIKFDMKGDHNGISGEVEFRYHDLRIHLVDKDTDKEKVVLNILSDSAGDFLFYRENPYRDKLRVGKFYVERDVRKGFISQWVEGLIQGIANTVSKGELDLEKHRD